MRSARPSRLNSMISSLTQRLPAAAGLHSTIRMARLSQRLAQHRGQIGRRGELVAIAEHREDLCWDRTARRLAADQRLGHTVAFDRLVQPPCPALVAMAVADEYRILAPGGNDTRRVHARLRPGRSSLAKIVTTTVVRQEDNRFAKEVSHPSSSRGDEALQKKLRENRPSSSTPPGSRGREALGYPAAICSAITGQ